jgi:L-lactate dehydrogenase complex protein LldG
MDDGKEAVLSAIRAGLAQALLPEASYEPPGPPPALEAGAAAPTDLESLRRSFVSEAQALSAQVYHPTHRTEAMNILLGIVESCEAHAVLAWDEEHLPLADTWGALAAAGVQVLDTMLPEDAAARDARLAELDRGAVGVTGALAGLADTGSLALPSGPGRGRLASLLPPVHVALLPVTSLYPTMAAFLAAHPGVVRQASNLVFISGPSRTADIEQTVTMGVHGPRELHVVLIPPTDWTDE